MERKTKARAETGVYLAIIAGILVVANVISYSRYKRFDVTKSERYSLSKGSARLVREGLDKELQVDVYVTRGLPKHEVFIQELTDLMNEYERASQGALISSPAPQPEPKAGMFHYAIIEPKTDEERTRAKEAGLQEATFGEGSKTGKEQALIGKGYMGIAFKYGSEKEAIPILSPDQSQGLEFWITNKVREIRDRADNRFQKFGILTGKDEIKLTEANLVPAQGGRGGGPNMRGVMEQALPFYKFEDVDLQNGDAEINKELVGIIITQPGKDFTDKELRRLDQFLMRGNKAIVIYAGAVNMKANDASMKATLNTHGLEKLLDGYGIELKKDVVFDWARPALLQVMTQGQAFLLPDFGIVGAQHADVADDKQFLDSSFPGFFRIEELAFPYASTVVPHADKQPGAPMKVVVRTSPNASALTSDSVDLKIDPRRRPEAKGEQRAIAVSMEGKIKSAFGGKEGDGISAPAESADKSRLLIVASPLFLANPYARAGNAPPMPPQMAMMGPMGGDEELLAISQPYAQQYLTSTILAFKNTLDWMSGDPDLLAVSAKLLGEPKLTYLNIEAPKDPPTDPEEAKRQADARAAAVTNVQTSVKWTLTLLPALLFAAFGVLLWRIREGARANITLD